MAEDKTYFRIDFRSKTPISHEECAVIGNAAELVYHGQHQGTLEMTSGRKFTFNACQGALGERNILVVENQ